MNLNVKIDLEQCIETYSNWWIDSPLGRYNQCKTYQYKNEDLQNQDKTEDAENVEIVLTKNGFDETVNGQSNILQKFWNDPTSDQITNNTKGRFQRSINANQSNNNQSSLKEGDRICITTKLYGNLTYRGKDYNQGGQQLQSRGNCYYITNYKNPDFDPFIKKIKDLTDKGQVYTQEYKDLVSAVADGITVTDIINDAEYINSSGQKIKITPQQWVDWINNRGNVDLNLNVFVKNSQKIAKISKLLDILSVTISLYEDKQNYYSNRDKGIIVPIPATASTLIGIGSAGASGSIITAICASATGGGCIILVVVGSTIIGIATQMGSEYFFVNILTKDNINMAVNNAIGTWIYPPSIGTEEYIRGMCRAFGACL